jgi:hypothetical protein
MSEAREAFQATIDAESPTRSRKANKEEKQEQTTDMDDLFPNRGIDRSEGEGGADDEPDVVKQARERAKSKEPPRDPTEGNDEDDAEELPDADALEDEDTPEDEQEDEEEAEPGQLDLNLLVEVTIDGQPHQVKLKEALRGYIREQTFHQRLGQVQQGFQVLEQARSETEQVRAAMIERAQLLEDYLGTFLPTEPDWDAYYAKNPAEAAQLERKWKKFGEKVGGMIQMRQQMQQEQQHAQIQAINQFAETNRVHLAQRHPEWKQEKVWRRDHDSMRKTARTAGYTDQEINQLYDARGVEILLKAAKYDRAMATKLRPVTSAKRTSVATPFRNASRSFDKAEKRLSRTGSLNDAARVFERILEREG